MRYHFIDRINRLVVDREIETVKAVTLSEDFFQDHFVGYPVMPGALQIEAMAQAAGALVEISSSYTRFSILLTVEKMKFKKIVRPGDQMIVTARFISHHEESAMLETKITVDDRVVSAGQLMVGIVSAASSDEQFAAAISTLEAYFKPLLKGAEIILPQP